MQFDLYLWLCFRAMVPISQLSCKQARHKYCYKEVLLMVDIMLFIYALCIVKNNLELYTNETYRYGEKKHKRDRKGIRRENSTNNNPCTMMYASNIHLFRAEMMSHPDTRLQSTSSEYWSRHHRKTRLCACLLESASYPHLHVWLSCEYAAILVSVRKFEGAFCFQFV